MSKPVIKKPEILSDDKLFQVFLDKVVGSTPLHQTVVLDKNRDIPLLEAQNDYCYKEMLKEIEPIREALEDMVFQFGYRGVKNKKPIIWTGGLSALEGAFEMLGWDDPHYLPEEGYTCEIVGCMEHDTCGTHWGDSPLYLRLCSKHYQESYSGKPLPKVKQWALDREATRDPVTHCLPFNPS